MPNPAILMRLVNHNIKPTRPADESSSFRRRWKLKNWLSYALKPDLICSGSGTCAQLWKISFQQMIPCLNRIHRQVILKWGQGLLVFLSSCRLRGHWITGSTGFKFTCWIQTDSPYWHFSEPKRRVAKADDMQYWIYRLITTGLWPHRIQPGKDSNINVAWHRAPRREYNMNFNTNGTNIGCWNIPPNAKNRSRHAFGTQRLSMLFIIDRRLLIKTVTFAPGFVFSWAWSGSYFGFQVLIGAGQLLPPG